MRQLSRLLLATLLFSLAISVAHAVSVLSQIKPDKKDVNGFAFAIKAERLKDGSFQFNVVITPNDGKKFGLGGTGAGLGIVKITSSSQSFSQSITGGRSLDAQKSDQSITCVFTVSAKELADQDLSFVFSQAVGFEQDGKFVPMPGVIMCYAKLADFIKP